MDLGVLQACMRAWRTQLLVCYPFIFDVGSIVGVVELQSLLKQPKIIRYVMIPDWFFIGIEKFFY